MSLLKLNIKQIDTTGIEVTEIASASSVNLVQDNLTALSANVVADANTWTNANDYSTYNTLTSLIDTVQANLTSLVSAAPTTLDTLAEIAAALENDANIAVTLTNSIGTVQSNVTTLTSTAAANDYSTYTTLSGEFAANDYSTLLAAQANDYNSYTTLSGEFAANDHNSYTTLVGFINTVQDNVSAGGGGDASNAWVNANDYVTYTTLQGEFAANDYSTLLAAQANDYNSYTTLSGEFAANDYSTLLAAQANDYNSYTTLQGEFAANDYSTLLAAQANDYNSYTTLSGEVAANDYSTLLAAQSNDYNSYTTLQSEFAANDYATYLAAQSNDYNSYTTLSGEFAANDYATLLSAQANDYNSYTTLQGELAANDYSTLLAAQSNDYATYTTLSGEFAANDYNSYTTLVGFINTVQDNVSAGGGGGDASNAWVNANDYSTYTTLVGLINTVQDNIASSTTTTTVSDQFIISTDNTFTLSSSVSDANNIIVSIEGVIQYPHTDYVVSDTTLTLSNTIPLTQGLTVEVRQLSSAATSFVTDVVFEEFNYLANANQTVFSGTDAYGNTLSFDTDRYLVFINGIKLYPTDYTANTITNVVTLTEATAANDEVNITTVKASETTIPAMVLLASATASNDASIEFTLDNSKYSSYQVVLDSLLPSTDSAELFMRFSSDGGSTFDSGAGNYQYASRWVAANDVTGSTSNDSAIAINLTNTIGTSAGETGANGKLDLTTSGEGRPSVRWQLSRTSGSSLFVYQNGGAERTATVEVDAVQFLFSSGNIASGKIHLYGLK
jgi:hypothetical protein